jgi:hypothetical protein
METLASDVALAFVYYYYIGGGGLLKKEAVFTQHGGKH